MKKLSDEDIQEREEAKAEEKKEEEEEANEEEPEKKKGFQVLDRMCAVIVCQAF